MNFSFLVADAPARSVSLGMVMVVIAAASEGPEPVPTSQPVKDAGSRVVAILRVPVGTDGTTIDFLIRLDELPSEFKALRDKKMPEVIEVLKKKLAE